MSLLSATGCEVIQMQPNTKSAEWIADGNVTAPQGTGIVLPAPWPSLKTLLSKLH